MSNFYQNIQNKIYYHFSSKQECDKFVNSIVNKYGYFDRCCDGNGIVVNLSYKIEIDKLHINFIKENNSKINLINKKDFSDENCSICYENCDTAPICGHTICMKCIKHGKLSKCPICSNRIM
jgi:hypothetical protein